MSSPTPSLPATNFSPILSNRCPRVAESLAALKPHYKLLIVTKGDLLNQEQKIARSGLADWFDAVEIVSEKDELTYVRLFDCHGNGPEHALMVGNSVRSDILPALAVGAWAAHVPYHVTWAHEVVDVPVNHPRFVALERMDQLPGWLAGGLLGDAQRHLA